MLVAASCITPPFPAAEGTRGRAVRLGFPHYPINAGAHDGEPPPHVVLHVFASCGDACARWYAHRAAFFPAVGCGRFHAKQRFVRRTSHACIRSTTLFFLLTGPPNMCPLLPPRPQKYRAPRLKRSHSIALNLVIVYGIVQISRSLGITAKKMSWFLFYL